MPLTSVFLKRRGVAILASAGVALLTLLAGPAVRANHEPEPTIDGAPLAKLINSELYFYKLTQFLRDYEQTTGQCAEAEPAGRARTLIVSERIAMPDIEDESIPQWIEVINVEGCVEPFERLVFTTRNRGRMVFLPLVRGDTRANPVLQSDIAGGLLPVEKARATKAGCAKDEPVRILTAKSADAPEDAPEGAWSEIWRVRNCNGDHDVRIDFRPSESGSTIFDIRSDS